MHAHYVTYLGSLYVFTRTALLHMEAGVGSLIYRRQGIIYIQRNKPEESNCWELRVVITTPIYNIEPLIECVPKGHVIPSLQYPDFTSDPKPQTPKH